MLLRDNGRTRRGLKIRPHGSRTMFGLMQRASFQLPRLSLPCMVGVLFRSLLLVFLIEKSIPQKIFFVNKKIKPSSQTQKW